MEYTLGRIGLSVNSNFVLSVLQPKEIKAKQQKNPNKHTWGQHFPLHIDPLYLIGAREQSTKFFAVVCIAALEVILRRCNNINSQFFLPHSSFHFCVCLSVPSFAATVCRLKSQKGKNARILFFSPIIFNLSATRWYYGDNANRNKNHNVKLLFLLFHTVRSRFILLVPKYVQTR